MNLLWTTMFLHGAMKTTQTQAYILNSLHGPLIVLFNLLVGLRPLKVELVGLLLAAIGTTLVVIDPHALRKDGTHASKSDFVTLASSSIFGAFYFLMNARNMKMIPIGILIFLVSCHLFVFSSAAAILSSNGKAVVFSTDAAWGCFGFL
jgi:hypothetical protein